MSVTNADTRAALRDVAERYAAGVDRRDAELFLSTFVPDARLLVFNPSASPEPSGTRRGSAELAAVITRVARHECTYHLIGNSRYEVDGADATGEVYCVAHHLDRAGTSPDAGTDHIMYIRYHDRYRREAGTWRIVERRVLVDWTETRPVELPPIRTPTAR